MRSRRKKKNLEGDNERRGLREQVQVTGCQWGGRQLTSKFSFYTLFMSIYVYFLLGTLLIMVTVNDMDWLNGR